MCGEGGGVFKSQFLEILCLNEQIKHEQPTFAVMSRILNNMCNCNIL